MQFSQKIWEQVPKMRGSKGIDKQIVQMKSETSLLSTGSAILFVCFSSMNDNNDTAQILSNRVIPTETKV